ncbi:hypothetical protein MMC24_003681 [Lignoscripta atroalba]|nr:hypothetical protein [Lignoscripta atroalba]
MAAVGAATVMPTGQVSVPQIVDYIWQYVSHQINSGFVDEVLLPFTFKRVIGSQGFEVLETRFKYLIQAPVTTVEDPVGGVIRIMPTRNPEGTTFNSDAPETKKIAPVTKKAKVPRPPNAFILYRQHHHPLIKAKNPDMHNNQISIILGSQWKDEEEATRAHFRSMAEALKKKHLMEHPEYSYQPRKPSDKKRRMTRRKAAVLADLSETVLLTDTTTPTTVNTSSSESTTSPGTEYVSDMATPDVNGFDKEEDVQPAMLPKFETTQAGNIMVNIGDEDLEDQELAAMLDAYNKDIPAPSTARTRFLQSTTTPVLYAERSEAAQNDVNFYSSMIDWDTIDRENDEAIARIQAELDNNPELFWTDMNVGINQRTSLFDSANKASYEAELARMSSVFE